MGKEKKWNRFWLSSHSALLTGKECPSYPEGEGKWGARGEFGHRDVG